MHLHRKEIKMQIKKALSDKNISVEAVAALLGIHRNSAANIISEQEYRKFVYDERKRRLYQDNVVKYA